MSAPVILVVEHEDQCPAAWMGEWLVEAGAVLDVRRPTHGDLLPEDLAEVDGLLVLGGEMGAYDDAGFPWLARVRQLFTVAAEGSTPALGICLGLQLAAVALGGSVAPNAGGQQVGVFGVGWAEEAHDDPLFSQLAARGSSADAVPAVQWNNDVVTVLPAAAVWLARMTEGPLQAARLAPTVWGVQWHPEVGEQIIAAWAEHDRDDSAERAVDLDARIADVAAAEPRLRQTWPALAQGFVSICDAARRAEVADR